LRDHGARRTFCRPNLVPRRQSSPWTRRSLPKRAALPDVETPSMPERRTVASGSGRRETRAGWGRGVATETRSARRDRRRRSSVAPHRLWTEAVRRTWAPFMWPAAFSIFARDVRARPRREGRCRRSTCRHRHLATEAVLGIRPRPGRHDRLRDHVHRGQDQREGRPNPASPNLPPGRERRPSGRQTAAGFLETERSSPASVGFAGPHASDFRLGPLLSSECGC